MTYAIMKVSLYDLLGLILVVMEVLVLGYLPIILISNLIISRQVIIDCQFNSYFVNYISQIKFNKTYSNQAEELERKQTFAESLRYILEHNKQAEQGLHTFTTGINEFSDLSTEEFHQTYLINDQTILEDHSQPTENKPEFMINTAATVPDSIDWTKKGLVTHVKNQGQCGSCWAFAAAATIEAQNVQMTGKLISLSEQNLLDCSISVDNLGCKGGWVQQAYKVNGHNNRVFLVDHLYT